ncbi:MAG: hypothetical protein FJ387_04120 [Verrucomicrobia bacterium]|nr:hypothetical protein [Verrucomicrobiota bacterium]
MTETQLIEDLRLLAPPSYRWLILPLAAVVTALAVVLGQRLRRRHRERPPSQASAASAGLAPWELALTELERLTPLLRLEHSRDYGIAATGVLRRYLEGRYALHAPRLTTEDFLRLAAASTALPLNHRDSLVRFLRLCDLFKFGRYVASAAELSQLHTAAVAFVLASRPPVNTADAAAAQRAAAHTARA